MTDKIMRQWRLNNFFRNSPSRGPRAVMRERDDSTLDRLWGIKPVYIAGIVMRRRGGETVKLGSNS